MQRLAIDPGNCTGWAIFSHAGLLQRCGVSTPKTKPTPKDLGLGPTQFRQGMFRGWALTIEMPEVTPTTPSIPDILKLCVSLGRYVDWFEDNAGGTVDYVKPASWKGQVPKEIHHPRIYAALRPEEQKILYDTGLAMADSKRHNMVDAVGLGLYSVGRRVR